MDAPQYHNQYDTRIRRRSRHQIPAPAPTAKQKLMELFASLVEVRRPDFGQFFSKVPIGDLESGREQVTSLIGGLARPNPEELNTDAVGRKRFPELHSVADRFAEGLAKNPDIVTEILAGPEDFTSAIALDQAIGRFIYAGELLTRGGDTGEVLAGAALQKMCTDVLSQARVRINDETIPAAVRSDIAVAFEEPFRLEDDQKQRQLAALSATDRSGQPYQNTLDQKQADSTLSDTIDAYMTGVQTPGVNKP